MENKELKYTFADNALGGVAGTLASLPISQAVLKYGPEIANKFTEAFSHAAVSETNIPSLVSSLPIIAGFAAGAYTLLKVAQWTSTGLAYQRSARQALGNPVHDFN